MSLLESIRSGHLREEIEKNFGRWGALSFRYRWLIIVTMMLGLIALFSQLKYIQFDSSMEGFFHDDDPALLRYNEFRNQYGREDYILVAVETDEVFRLEFLEKFRDLHEQLEERIPFLVDIDSLVNARHTLGVKDGIQVKDFLEDWPEIETDVQRLKQLALANPMYVGRFVSEEGHIAVIYLKNQVYKNLQVSDDDLLAGFDDDPVPEALADQELEKLGGKENHAIKTAIDEIRAEFHGPGFEIYAASGPYTTSTFMKTNRTNMMKYTGWAILFVAALLALIFKRVVMVFLPLSVSILAMMASMSIMAMLGIRLSFSMQIVPSFLMAVGVGNSVHVFTVFFQALDQGKSKQDAIAHAMQHSGLAITMTGLTTAGGLLSFLSSNMKPVAEFGTITPLGIMFALVFSLVLLPALIAVFPIRANRKKETDSFQAGLVRRVLVACGNYSVANPVKVLTVWAVITVAGLMAAFTIRFSFFIYDQLPSNHYLIEAVRLIDTEMSGASPLEIIVDSGRENGVKDPEFLKRIEQVYELVENFSHEGHAYEKIVSIVDINRELHQALNEKF
jgi:predicted RND superfamily exporter protein